MQGEYDLQRFMKAQALVYADAIGDLSQESGPSIQ